MNPARVSAYYVLLGLVLNLYAFELSVDKNGYWVLAAVTARNVPRYVFTHNFSLLRYTVVLQIEDETSPQQLWCTQKGTEW